MRRTASSVSALTSPPETTSASSRAQIASSSENPGVFGRSADHSSVASAKSFIGPSRNSGRSASIERRIGSEDQPRAIGSLPRALPNTEPPRIAAWLDAGQGAPIRRAAQTLETVLEAMPRGEATALILADAALARALGWGHAVPLLAAGLKRADLRKSGADLRTACHRAVTVTAIDAVRQAADLTRRAAHLRAVAPKLRAKGAGGAVDMFLTRDAVAPGALPLPDRAARRLCDRLVDLGAVRELTGRDTFRLYGV